MDATTIVLLLITLVSACIAIVWAYKAERRIDLLTERMDARQKDVSRHEGQIANHHQIQSSLVEIMGAHTRDITDAFNRVSAQETKFDNFIRVANGSEQKRDERLAAVESQVAGMQVSREVLTPSSEHPIRDYMMRAVKDKWGDKPLPDPAFHATAYVDGGHAATDFDLTAPDADPETAEAQPQPDDDQATAVNDVQAVEEWDEAKRGEVA